MGLRELLIPREKIFFQLLEEESKNVLAGAIAFSELIQNFDHLADKREKIKSIEHHGDEIVHSIYDRLVKTFITPIDREDISKLASLYDDVLDYIYAAVNRLFSMIPCGRSNSIDASGFLPTRCIFRGVIAAYHRATRPSHLSGPMSVLSLLTFRMRADEADPLRKHCSSRLPNILQPSRLRKPHRRFASGHTEILHNY